MSAPPWTAMAGLCLPRLALIPASGRSFGSFRQDVDAAVRRAYVASSATVAIGHVRQISVLVAGEVNVPGWAAHRHGTFLRGGTPCFSALPVA